MPYIGWALMGSFILLVVFWVWQGVEREEHYGERRLAVEIVLISLACIFTLAFVGSILAIGINSATPIEHTRTLIATDHPVALSLGSRVHGGGSFLSFFISQDGYFFYDITEKVDDKTEKLLFRQIPCRATQVYLNDIQPDVRQYKVRPVACWRTAWFGEGFDYTDGCGGTYAGTTGAGIWYEWEVWTPKNTVVQGVRIDPKDLS